MQRRLRRATETLWPTSLVDWLVILMLVGSLAALFLPAMAV